MQQRLSIARALAVKPELLVLDEAFKAMDEALYQRVLRLVSESAGDAALLLAADHGGQVTDIHIGDHHLAAHDLLSACQTDT